MHAYHVARSASLGAALLLAGFTTGAFAADNNAHVEGMLVGTYQAANHSRVNGQDVNNEANGQLELYGTMDMGPGTWNLEVRGSTTPRDNGVTSFYGSNALVGETLDSNGDGRISVTQLFYELPVGSGHFRVGLVDPTALLDGNDVANDEYTQFLADAFVNNPTIGFPSFVLGMGYEGKVSEHVDYRLFAGSDSGLEAEDDPTYHNVFDLGGRRDGHRKGAFVGGELGWHANGYALKAGTWYDTGKVDQLDASGDTNAYGFYALGTMPVGSGQLQARAGIANDKAQDAANFVSLAFQQPVQVGGRESILAFAVGRTGDSNKLGANTDPIYQAELYWRINVAGSFYVTPDVQYIKNPGFDGSQDGALVAGVRMGLVF